MARAAVVTGGNKGIGLGIVRGLCKQFDGVVYLTARDKSRGEKTVQDLKAEGLEPRFHQLDILDESSIDRLAKYLKDNYGGVDVLVNNAGVAYKAASTASVAEQAEVSMRTNYYGTVAVCKALFPLLKPGARVVHLSSMVSTSSYKQCSAAIKQTLDACTTVDAVSSCMDTFVECAKVGRLSEWTSSCYGCSKVGISLITPIQQREMDQSNSDIVVNACCPGYVSTDMTSFKGHKTIEDGADTPIYLALLPAGTDIRGQFVSNRKVKTWKK